jgi:hypothetical protein
MANIQQSIYPSAAPGKVSSVSVSSTTATRRLSQLTFVFALLSVVFFLLLVFLRIPFQLYPLMSWQDALDVLTPLVLIPLYWLMFTAIKQDAKDRAGEILFMLLAAFWIMGQGMHLSANSINNLIGNLAKNQVLDVNGTDLYRLTYFYDEILSHYLWHIGVLGLAALLMYASWRTPAAEKTNWRWVAPAVVLYGATCFCIFVEGLTTPLALPITGLAALVALLWGRKKLPQSPVLAFFTFAFLLTFVLIAGWSLYHGAFPPPELLK